MATKTSRNGPTTVQLRENLQADIRAFLKSGKKIQQIPNGVSGMDMTKGTRNIALGQNKRGAGT